MTLGKWTESELNTLRVSYENEIPLDVIDQLIPSRTKKSIVNQASKSGFSEMNVFRPEEVEYIQNNYLTMSLVDISKTLKRTHNIVCRKARELGLTRPGRKPKEQEEASLVKRIAREENQKVREQRAIEKEEKKKAGKKYHTPEYRKKVAVRVREMWKDPNSILNSEEFKQMQSDRFMRLQHQAIKGNKPLAGHSRGKGGTREDLGIYVRSSWEANYARYLNFLKERGFIHDWDFETDIFYFEKIKRGIRSYTPDFKVWKTENEYEYHEVKGYMDPKSLTKLERMNKFYPREKIYVIGQEEYKEIKKLSVFIENWEV